MGTLSFWHPTKGKAWESSKPMVMWKLCGRDALAIYCLIYRLQQPKYQCFALPWIWCFNFIKIQRLRSRQSSKCEMKKINSGKKVTLLKLHLTHLIFAPMRRKWLKSATKTLTYVWNISLTSPASRRPFLVRCGNEPNPGGNRADQVQSPKELANFDGKWGTDLK